MPILTRMVGMPLVLEIRPGAVSSLGAILADRRISADGQVAVLVGSGLGSQISQELARACPNARMFTAAEGTFASASDFASNLRKGHYDAVVGIGGGRTLDVAKYAATATGLPMVAVATSLAHDGVASPVASLSEGGKKSSYGVQPPLVVLIDLDYVARSPERMLHGGLGDVLSNLNAISDWDLAHQLRGEPVDGISVSLSRMAAEAIVFRTDSLRDRAFLQVLAEALVLSGVAMSAAGSSRPCSGACHEISHAIDLLFPGRSGHGEQVAVGALFASWLRSDPTAAVVDSCARRHGVPRLPEQLGLTLDEFAQAVAQAPDTRPDRFTVLEHLDMDGSQIRRAVDGWVEASA